MNSASSPETTAKAKRPGRPKKVHTYKSAPDASGGWWVRCENLTTGEPGPELRANVRWVPGAEVYAARIFHSVEDWTLVGALWTQGWRQWRTRRLVTQPAPRWRDFIAQAHARLAKKGGFKKGSDFAQQIAADIVAHGGAAAFLTAVRRGRSTQKQNLRYQVLREVERLAGDTVPRRREDANTPDAVALRAVRDLTLEAGTGRDFGEIKP